MKKPWHFVVLVVFVVGVFAIYHAVTQHGGVGSLTGGLGTK